MNSNDWFTTRLVASQTWAIDDHGSDVIYLIAGDERALLVDTGWGVGDLPGLVTSLTSLPLLVVNTHGTQVLRKPQVWIIHTLEGRHVGFDEGVHVLKGKVRLGQGVFYRSLYQFGHVDIRPLGYETAIESDRYDGNISHAIHLFLSSE